MRQSGSAAPSPRVFRLQAARGRAPRYDAGRRADERARALAAPHARDYLRAYRSGLFTCLTNPKSCAFWTSVFAAMLPAHVPLWFNGAVLETIGVLSAGWYSCVAYLFARARARARPLDARAAWRSSASVQTRGRTLKNWGLK